MSKTSQITIWDSDPIRIADISANITLAMKKLDVKYDIATQSETPLLSRMGLYGKTPKLEINGLYWTWEINKPIPLSAIEALLTQLKKQDKQTEK